MIVFTLTMPNIGPRNGHVTQERDLYVRTMDEREVPKELWGKSFYDLWEDGWAACVSVERMPAKDAAKLERKSKGFCGYDWMIKSLIKDGYIHYE